MRQFTNAILFGGWLLLNSGCTAQYIAEATRTGAATVALTNHFEVERTGNFRFVPGTRIFIAVADTTAPTQLPARELPWRLARAVNAAFTGPFLTTLATTAASREQARAAAAAAGSSLLVYPSLLPDAAPPDLWHRDALTVQLEIFEVVTGRPVDRVLLRGRAALSNAEIDTADLQSAMTEVAVNLSGGSAAADHRPENLL